MRARAFAAAAAAVPVLAGCGSTDRVGDTEDAVGEVLAQRLGVDAVDVACPDDADLDAGATVTCEVAVAGSDAQPVALEIGEGGDARLASAVIPVAAAEDYLAGELEGPAGSEVDVRCGDSPLLVGVVGDTFTCEAERTGDGATFDVTVELTALDGTVRYRVETTTSTTATTATTTP